MELDKVKPNQLAIGDHIMPPEAELRWMRRSAKEKGLTEDSLLLKVMEKIPGRKVDKKGFWTKIMAQYGRSFTAGYPRPYPEGREFNFFVLPTTKIFRAKATTEVGK